jgi:hypothetical protein
VSEVLDTAKNLMLLPLQAIGSEDLVGLGDRLVARRVEPRFERCVSTGTVPTKGQVIRDGGNASLAGPLSRVMLEQSIVVKVR